MKNNCKAGTHCGTIIGGVFLVVATVLTVLTHSDAGVLGMFLVGLGFCVCGKMGGCKKCSCCGCCSCCCTCDCCEGKHPMGCDTTPAKKKAAPRKKAKKTA
ncbi:MAG: hypothetical protein NXI01_04420 [Gammaproteobacteria bacterium]|nr:hypothetical protein [Gammaproteobacteria bacterium]